MEVGVVERAGAAISEQPAQRHNAPRIGTAVVLEQRRDLQQVAAHERNAFVKEHLEAPTRGIARRTSVRQPPQRSHQPAPRPVAEEAGSRG
jgi:hypothetical protein